MKANLPQPEKTQRTAPANYKPWILFVEGLPGSGKSGTAKALHEFLSRRGFDSELHLENSPQNPVGFVWRFETAYQTLAKTNFEDYPFGLWDDFAQSGKSAIFEARLLQNTSLFAMLNGQDPSTIRDFPRVILERLSAHASCALILLHSTKARDHLKTTIAAREPVVPRWFPFCSKLFADQPWCQQRGLSEDLAFVDTMVHWSELQHSLVQGLALERLIINDASDDWSQANEQLRNWTLAWLQSLSS